MPDNKKLIADANNSLVTVSTYPETTKAQSAKIKQYFRYRNILFSQIDTEVKSCTKDADACDKRITEAEKALKALSAAKADAVLEKNLSTAIKEGKAALKALRADLDLLAKVTVEAEKNDSKLAETIAVVLKAGKPVAASVKNYVTIVADQTDSVQEGFDKNWPPQAITNILRQVTKDTKEVGSTITTAESISSSVTTLSKKRGDAFLPATRKALEEAEAMQTAMDKDLAKLRPLYNTAVSKLKAFGDKLKAAA